MIISITHPDVWGVPLYPIFYFLGSFISLLLAFYVVHTKENYRYVRYFDLMLAVWLSGVVGAKALALILTPSAIHKILSHGGWMQLLEGGYHLSGGILSGMLIFLFLVRRWKLPFWKSVHLLLWVALPGLAVGRMGCIFAGCCFGKVSVSENFPILFQYDPHSYWALLSRGPRLPTQLFDLLGVFILAAGVWVPTSLRSWQMSDFKRVGGLLSVVLMGFGALRWIESFYRDILSRTDSPVWGVYFSQWTALFLLLLGAIVGIFWFWRNWGRNGDIYEV